jgi:hypothetical protein
VIDMVDRVVSVQGLIASSGSYAEDDRVVQLWAGDGGLVLLANLSRCQLRCWRIPGLRRVVAARHTHPVPM